MEIILLQLTQGHLTAVQTVTVNALFASLTQQKALKSPDWAEVLEKAIDLSSLVELITDDVAPTMTYQEYVGKFTSTFGQGLGTTKV